MLIISAYVVDSDGKLVANARKHFLYETDYKWAEEGESFKAVDVIIKKDQSSIKVGLGICMDLNPKGERFSDMYLQQRL
jgi:protein N-terminal amidase